MNKTLISIIFSAALALSACGGGGGGGSDDSPTAPTTGAPFDASHLTAINANQIDRATAGQGVTAAIVDIGFQPQHDEFPGSPMLINVTGGDHDEGFRDHGTGVASMMIGQNLGVAPQTRLLFFNRGTATVSNPDSAGTTAGTVAGINAAIAENPAVIQISSRLAAQDSVRDAIQSATDAGIVVVVAAGNSGTGLTDWFAEAADARYSNSVIVVGAFDRRTGDLASNSNIATIEGTSEISPIFLSAPAGFVCSANDQEGAVGDQVRTCSDTRVSPPSTNGAVSGYTFSGGTSLAAPQVGGAAVLINQIRPDLSAAEIVQVLLSTATDVGAPGTDGINGAGLLNVAAALALAENS